MYIDIQEGRAEPEVAVQGSQRTCCGGRLLDSCPHISPQVHQKLYACKQQQMAHPDRLAHLLAGIACPMKPAYLWTGSNLTTPGVMSSLAQRLDMQHAVRVRIWNLH